MALAFFSVPAFARIARAATLRLREQTFMAAARLSGTPALADRCSATSRRTSLPQLMTFALLGMGIVIIIEGALSFLGLGIPPPAPSWGNMIAHGQQTLSATPELVAVPSAFLFVTVLSFNLLGDCALEGTLAASGCDRVTRAGRCCEVAATSHGDASRRRAATRCTPSTG